MLALARAITQREICTRTYVAVDARRNIVKLWSPKNSKGVMTRCSRQLADKLAALIRESL